MKLLLSIILVTLGVQQRDLKQFSWLEGEWERTGLVSNRRNIETWLWETDKWVGTSITIRDGIEVAREEMRIETRNGKLYYAALVSENKEWVYFEITQTTSTSFACENPEHDFPKKIAYQFDGGKQLHATISAGDKSIDFYFNRTK